MDKNVFAMFLLYHVVRSHHKFLSQMSMTDADPNPGAMLSGPNDETKIHCVIFCLPISEMFTATPSPITKRAREFVNVCAQESVQSMIVLTKADEADPEFSQKVPGDFSDEVKAARSKASTDFGIPENLVFPFAAYIKDTHKNLNIDKNSYVILDEARRICQGQNLTSSLSDLIFS